MEGLAAAAFCFGLVGVVALVRLEKLIKTLKEKGVLEHDYKDEWLRSDNSLLLPSTSDYPVIAPSLMHSQWAYSIASASEPFFLIWAELDLLDDGGFDDVFKGAIGFGYHESVRGGVV